MIIMLILYFFYDIIISFAIALGLCLFVRTNHTTTSSLLLITYTVFSGLSFLIYGFDKLCAKQGAYRISERVLLIVDTAGGWPGGWLAQVCFNHKVRKVSYQRRFWFSASLNMLFWLWWQNRISLSILHGSKNDPKQFGGFFSSFWSGEGEF